MYVCIFIYYCALLRNILSYEFVGGGMYLEVWGLGGGAIKCR